MLRVMAKSTDWDWKRMWNAVAFGNDPYDQMGRVGWTLPHFVSLIAELTRQAQLGPTSRVLDLGGGAGWVAASLSPFVAQVTVVDFAEAQLARAAAAVGSGLFPNMTVRPGDVRALSGIPDHSVNRVLCVGVLQYLESVDDVRAALAAISRVLEPGGLALVGHNPVIAKRAAWTAAHEASWDEKRRALEAQRLWFDAGVLEQLAAENGLQDYRELPIHPMFPGAEFMNSCVLSKGQSPTR
jgi:ubiquinone/menaquinone biosynthesis C-methylase UbiE